MAPRQETSKKWHRLAGKAFIRFGTWEWPDPNEPLSCLENSVYRKRIKRIFRSGEEIFIGKPNTLFFFERMIY